MREINQDLDEHLDMVSATTQQASEDWFEYQNVIDETFDKFSMNALSGYFNMTMNVIRNGIDDVSSKYGKRMSELEDIVNNSALSMEGQIVSTFNVLRKENAFKDLSFEANGIYRNTSKISIWI